MNQPVASLNRYLCGAGDEANKTQHAVKGAEKGAEVMSARGRRLRERKASLNLLSLAIFADR